jgi:hypothetical protein
VNKSVCQESVTNRYNLEVVSEMMLGPEVCIVIDGYSHMCGMCIINIEIQKDFFCPFLC